MLLLHKHIHTCTNSGYIILVTFNCSRKCNITPHLIRNYCSEGDTVVKLRVIVNCVHKNPKRSGWGLRASKKRGGPSITPDAAVKSISSIFPNIRLLTVLPEPQLQAYQPLRRLFSLHFTDLASLKP